MEIVKQTGNFCIVNVILWFFSDAELFLKLLNQRKTFSFFLFYKPAGVLNAHSPISELSLLVKLFSLEHSGPQM